MDTYEADLLHLGAEQSSDSRNHSQDGSLPATMTKTSRCPAKISLLELTSPNSPRKPGCDCSVLQRNENNQSIQLLRSAEKTQPPKILKHFCWNNEITHLLTVTWTLQTWKKFF
jgi:hypothetical protein